MHAHGRAGESLFFVNGEEGFELIEVHGESRKLEASSKYCLLHNFCGRLPAPGSQLIHQ
jgi:hypothetical protein